MNKETQEQLSNAILQARNNLWLVGAISDDAAIKALIETINKSITTIIEKMIGYYIIKKIDD